MCRKISVTSYIGNKLIYSHIMPTINIIAAIDTNRAIGYRNKLLFHIDEDMKRFRQLTIGHTIIMGRRTYESLPGGALPQRRNIIVSSTLASVDNGEVYKSIDEALAACRGEEEIFIIGGEAIYRATIGMADRLYLTIIYKTAKNADAWFPEYDGWHMTECIKKKGYSFSVFEKPYPEI